MQLRIVSKNYTRASLRKISCFKKLYQGLSYNNFSCEQWRQESKVFCTVSVAKNLFKVTRRDWRRCFCFLCLFVYFCELWVCAYLTLIVPRTIFITKPLIKFCYTWYGSSPEILFLVRLNSGWTPVLWIETRLVGSSYIT